MKRVCEVEGCKTEEVVAKGLCWMHYRRLLRTGTTNNPSPNINSGVTCSVEKCTNEAHSKGLCPKHYSRHKARGTTSVRVFSNTLKCTIEGCPTITRSSGMCQKHYSRFVYRRRTNKDLTLEEFIAGENVKC